MPGGPGDLYGAARELLDAAVDAVATATGGPIDRAFVAPGPPAWDCCPQLTVHAGGPQEAGTARLSPPLEPAHRTTTQGALNLATLTVTVIRCVPAVGEHGEMPEPALLEAAAEDTLGDCWAIWNHVRSRHRDGSLLQNHGGTRELYFDPAVALRPAGGCAGWELPFRVELGGYRA